MLFGKENNVSTRLNGERRRLVKKNLKGLQNRQLNVHLNEEKLPWFELITQKKNLKGLLERANKGTSLMKNNHLAKFAN